MAGTAALGQALARARAEQGRAHCAPAGALTLAGQPGAGLGLFSVVLLGWHVPAMFDATLHSEVLHALEHTLFFTVAILFFKQVIPSPPLRARLGDIQRLLFVVAGMTVSWVLAVILALAPKPLYPYTPTSHHAPAGSRRWPISSWRPA